MQTPLLMLVKHTTTIQIFCPPLKSMSCKNALVGDRVYLAFVSLPMCCVPQALKPGGRLFFTDYARSADTPSKGFAAYIQQRQYDLHTVEGYGKLLQEAGFVDVRAEDQTHLVSINHLRVSNSASDAIACEDQMNLLGTLLSTAGYPEGFEACLVKHLRLAS